MKKKKQEIKGKRKKDTITEILKDIQSGVKKKEK